MNAVLVWILILIFAVLLGVGIWYIVTRYHKNTTSGKLHAKCSTSSDCNSPYICDTSVNRCLVPADGSCVQNSDCVTGICNSTVCSSTNPGPTADSIQSMNNNSIPPIQNTTMDSVFYDGSMLYLQSDGTILRNDYRGSTIITNNVHLTNLRSSSDGRQLYGSNGFINYQLVPGTPGNTEWYWLPMTAATGKVTTCGCN